MQKMWWESQNCQYQSLCESLSVWIWPTWGNPFWWSNATQHSIAAIAEVSSDLKCALQFQNFIFKGQWTWLLALCTYYIAEHIIRITKYSNAVINKYIHIYVCI
jgi:hypothetical protein